jgi:Sulfotransferase domain
MTISQRLERAGEKIVDVLPDRPRIAIKRKVRRLWEENQFDKADVTVIAHPKSGSTWLRFQLARLYQRKHGLDEKVIPDVERLHKLDPSIPQIYMAGYEFMKLVLAKPAPQSELVDKACIFLLRHPIDVTVSLYFHIQKHAQRERKLFNDWPLDLSGTSMMDFITGSHWGLMEAIGFYNNCLRHADTMRRAHAMRYEDMLQQHFATLKEIAGFIDHPVTDADVQEAVEFTSFERLRDAEMKNTFNTPRLHAANPNDPNSFKVRRAKLNGYRDYFDADQLAVLEGMVNSNLDPRAGYGTAAQQTD